MQNAAGRSVLFLISSCILLFAFCVLRGCDKQSSQSTQQVTLYTSVDQPIAAPIVKAFETKTGIKVNLVTDAEATKSVGLAERLRAEKDNPQCDVFWGNEPFHTINLADEGVLAPYQSPMAADVPAQFKHPQHLWASNGLRARVIGIAPGATKPASIKELAQPEFKDRIAMARPTAGTTAGHMAALYVLWGDEKAKRFFSDLHANNVKLLGGNSVVTRAIADGTAVVGLTDNDDVSATLATGGKIEQVLPDQDASAEGTLMVPTTVALVAGAKDADAGTKLIDYLLSPEVEKQLIDAQFAGWSVRDVAGGKVKAMKIDYREVAKAMPKAMRESTAILEGRE